MNKYRFEYGKVYELNKNAYEYLCNYFQAGINNNDSESLKIRKAGQYSEYLNWSESEEP